MSVSSLTESKYKELSDIERENKDYYTQVEQMNNRIKSLKMQQEDLNKKINSLKAMENQKKKFQSFKQKNHDDLLGNKLKTEKMIKVKRELVLKEKENRSRSLQSSKSRCQQEKNRNFEERRAEHLFTSSTLTQYYNYKTNLNKYKIVKAKMSHVEYQTEKEKGKSKSAGKRNLMYLKKIEDRKEKSGKLKSQLTFLEKNEVECLSQLNTSLKIKDEIVKNKSWKILEGVRFKKTQSFFQPKSLSKTPKESTSSKPSIHGVQMTKQAKPIIKKVKANQNVRGYSASRPHLTKKRLE